MITKKIIVINRYYKITRFYPFLKGLLIKGGLGILGFLALLMLVDYFFIDMHVALNNLVQNYSTAKILLLFFSSETFLGLIPPEVFIAWASKSSFPWIMLLVLASLSYLGGVISYFIGKWVNAIPSVKLYIQNKVADHIANLRKWGGLFVLIGAMLPLPHSVVSMACGLIRFKFQHYVLWALFRFIRFFLYAMVIFKAL